MKRFVLAAIVMLGLSELAPAKGQFVVGPARPYGYRGGFAYSYRSNFGFAYGVSNFRFSAFSGGFVTRSFFVPPPVFNPFGGPFVGGWGPGFGPPVVAVPVPVPVPVQVPGANGDPEPLPLPPRNDGALFPKGDFIVIAPNKEVMVPDVKKVAPVPKPPGPMVAFDPFRPPAKVVAEVPEADPKKEAARLIKLARESFAAGDYGRAAENFDRAITADPNDPRTYFLHAQAKFAAGQYAEAVARIREGLARDPNWPAAAFDPAELYGVNPERFILHLFALKKTLGENPNQATLEFLMGYQLWFAGDKEEADRFFRAAERRLPAPGPIALFK
jgi:Tfp pilus assembly protein PilF